MVRSIGWRVTPLVLPRACIARTVSVLITGPAKTSLGPHTPAIVFPPDWSTCRIWLQYMLVLQCESSRPFVLGVHAPYRPPPAPLYPHLNKKVGEVRTTIPAVCS